MDALQGKRQTIINVAGDEKEDDRRPSVTAPNLTASQLILQSIDEGPAVVADSLFSRIFCGLRFGRAMEGTALIICALSLVFFLALFLTPGAALTIKITVATALSAVAIPLTARLAYDEHRLLAHDNWNREMVQLRRQVGELSTVVDQLSPEVDRLGTSNKVYEDLNTRMQEKLAAAESLVEQQRTELARQRTENERYHSENDRLTASNEKHQTLLDEQQEIITALEESKQKTDDLNSKLQSTVEEQRNELDRQRSENDRYQSENEKLTQNVTKLSTEVKELTALRDTLRISVAQLAEDRNFTAAMQKVEIELTKKQMALNEQLATITQAQAEMQTKEEAMIKRAEDLEEERNRLQQQLEEQTQKQVKLTRELSSLGDTLARVSAWHVGRRRILEKVLAGKISPLTLPERGNSVFAVARTAMAQAGSPLMSPITRRALLTLEDQSTSPPISPPMRPLNPTPSLQSKGRASSESPPADGGEIFRVDTDDKMSEVNV